MRYRQSNQQPKSGDQQVKELINNNDVLSTAEQEEVIAYFAQSLRVSTRFLQVVVCLHVIVALVYVALLLSGSMMLDLEVDHAATSRMFEVAQRQQGAAKDIMATASPSPPGAEGAATTTSDPLAVLAALDAQQRAANRKYTQDYLARRGDSLSSKSLTLTNIFSAMVTLLSAGLLLWAAWSGYMACRMLRVNVDDLTGTEPRELGASSASFTPAATQRSAKAAAASHGVSLRGRWRALRQRIRSEPPITHYAIACLAAVASCFWLAALLSRQRSMRAAYLAAGLQAPSVFASHKVTDAALEYLLAVWQPLFHLAIGRLLQSMLDTKENLVSLSKMKYRFDKV